ncbi:hypothetical protein [Synechococcus sp. MIT S9504]|uniref:hypothetical protein n=2 Tax=Synechococcus sp. MIT S9504 TaxID=1801628 RepID=UPI0012E8116E
MKIGLLYWFDQEIAASIIPPPYAKNLEPMTNPSSAAFFIVQEPLCDLILHHLKHGLKLNQKSTMLMAVAKLQMDGIWIDSYWKGVISGAIPSLITVVGVIFIELYRGKVKKLERSQKKLSDEWDFFYRLEELYIDQLKECGWKNKHKVIKDELRKRLRNDDKGGEIRSPADKRKSI